MPSSSSKHNQIQRRITKTEKIAELQSKMKLLIEENRLLRNNHDKLDFEEGSIKANSDHDKITEALRALKRVTIKQEMSLATLRQRSKQRRSEIEQKCHTIKTLQTENVAYRFAHEKIKEYVDTDDAVSILRARLADLELQLAKKESFKIEQSEILIERKEGVLSLQAKLANKERGVTRKTSSDSVALSLMSASSSLTSVEDFARMKKDLARKTEKITNLQHELEACKDEIHDLKQRYQFSNSFPITTAQGDADDLFEDDDIDEDVWETF